MNVKSRLEIYASKDTKDRAVIIGEKNALRELGNALLQAANTVSGWKSVNLYKGNGHDYEIFVTKNIDEEEWQNIPDCPEKLSFINDFDNLKKSLSE